LEQSALDLHDALHYTGFMKTLLMIALAILLPATGARAAGDVDDCANSALARVVDESSSHYPTARVGTLRPHALYVVTVGQKAFGVTTEPVPSASGLWKCSGMKVTPITADLSTDACALAAVDAVFPPTGLASKPIVGRLKQNLEYLVKYADTIYLVATQILMGTDGENKCVAGLATPLKTR
jgi:hypothetical protein